jgi:transcriptional regulator with GAF, ATPase, and Fis domain
MLVSMRYERESIIEKLQSNIKHETPVAETARQLGIAPSNLSRFMTKEGIRVAKTHSLAFDKR